MCERCCDRCRARCSPYTMRRSKLNLLKINKKRYKLFQGAARVKNLRNPTACSALHQLLLQGVTRKLCGNEQYAPSASFFAAARLSTLEKKLRRSSQSWVRNRKFRLIDLIKCSEGSLFKGPPGGLQLDDRTQVLAEELWFGNQGPTYLRVKIWGMLEDTNAIVETRIPSDVACITPTNEIPPSTAYLVS